jgi:uncharacterized protein (DUF934 family)
MRKLIKDAQIVDDDWLYPGSEVAAGQRAVLPLGDYLAWRAAGPAAAGHALLLRPEDQDLASLQPYLGNLPLIVIQFANSGEGRGYSQARLLRDRFGYAGELRASGAVRIDQVYFLARCGFNAFDLVDGENLDAALAQLGRFSVAYQQGTAKALTSPRLRYGH